MRLLTNEKLPDEESDFFELLSCYFPKIYDVKYLMKSCKNLKGGLQEVADQLKVRVLWLLVRVLWLNDMGSVVTGMGTMVNGMGTMVTSMGTMVK